MGSGARQALGFVCVLLGLGLSAPAHASSIAAPRVDAPIADAVATVLSVDRRLDGILNPPFLPLDRKDRLELGDSWVEVLHVLREDGDLLLFADFEGALAPVDEGDLLAVRQWLPFEALADLQGVFEIRFDVTLTPGLAVTWHLLDGAHNPPIAGESIVAGPDGVKTRVEASVPISFSQGRHRSVLFDVWISVDEAMADVALNGAALGTIDGFAKLRWVPEPSLLVLLLFGAAGLYARNRGRNAR